jgi:hypothetical protein
MKKSALMILVIAGLLSGCVAYSEPGGRDGGYRDRDHDGVPNRMDRDRDGDGVRDRNDSAPNNPNRY